MAASTTWQDIAAPPSDLADRRDRQGRFQAARRHSRLVRRLRVLLPVAGAAALAGFSLAAQIGLPDELDLTTAGMSVTRSSIIMENPQLTGFDADKRQYSVAADRAIQSLLRPDEVRLEDISAKVTVTGRGAATVTAEAGDYDHTESTLLLYGNIELASSDGYALHMHDAEIDFAKGTLASSNPVSVTFEDATTAGSSLSVSDSGDLIVIEGAVRTTLLPPKRSRADSMPAASSTPQPQLQ